MNATLKAPNAMLDDTGYILSFPGHHQNQIKKCRDLVNLRRFGMGKINLSTIWCPTQNSFILVTFIWFSFSKYVSNIESNAKVTKYTYFFNYLLFIRKLSCLSVEWNYRYQNLLSRTSVFDISEWLKQKSIGFVLLIYFASVLANCITNSDKCSVLRLHMHHFYIQGLFMDCLNV